MYLDEGATTQPKKEVVKLVSDLLQSTWMNPSSIYSGGKLSKSIIEQARLTVAQCINAQPNEIYFTPSASASNTLAIIGYLTANNCKNFVTTSLEHNSISKIEVSQVKKTIIPCDSNGFVTATQFDQYKNCLISVMGANNEIGTIQPIKDIADVVHNNNCLIHTDLTQYIPHIKVDVQSLSCDMCTFSAHKIGGIKGCGVLYVRNGIKLQPFVFGAQENGLIGGTENIYAIAAVGKAMELLDYQNEQDIINKRNYLLNRILNIEGTHLNGSINNRISNNLNIRIDGIDGQNLVLLLDAKGYQLSTQSACHSSSIEPSSVLTAIGLTKEQALSSIRISLGECSYQDINGFIEAFEKTVFLLRSN